MILWGSTDDLHFTSWLGKLWWDFPSGTVEKSPPTNAQGILAQPLVRKIPHASRGLSQLLSLSPATTVAHVPRACAPLQQEKPPQLEAPRTATKWDPIPCHNQRKLRSATQQSQKETKKKILWLLDLLQCWCKSSTVIADDINHLQTPMEQLRTSTSSFLQSTLQPSIHTCTHTRPWFTITVISGCVLLDLPFERTCPEKYTQTPTVISDPTLDTFGPTLVFVLGLYSSWAAPT